MKKIVFHSNQLGLRGTEVALFDYARYNEEILGNASLVVFDGGSVDNREDVICKFKKRFDVHEYALLDDFDEIVKRSGADCCYFIKSGYNDGVISSACVNLVHAVFYAGLGHVHGERYAFVSKWLSSLDDYKVPYVPHIVDFPKVTGDLRARLGIPKDAFVFGCYGGADTFNIPFVKQALLYTINTREDAWFIFMNINPFTSNERVIFLPGEGDIGKKALFINTCDAMLHGRDRGETFGLACAEFAVSNRPVITYFDSPERSHIEILADRGIYYRDLKDIKSILASISHSYVRSRDWDAYSEAFSPTRVMKIFSDVFLS